MNIYCIKCVNNHFYTQHTNFIKVRKARNPRPVEPQIVGQRYHKTLKKRVKTKLQFTESKIGQNLYREVVERVLYRVVQRFSPKRIEFLTSSGFRSVVVS